jgi:hypothetical protein
MEAAAALGMWPRLLVRRVGGHGRAWKENPVGKDELPVKV